MSLNRNELYTGPSLSKYNYIDTSPPPPSTLPVTYPEEGSGGLSSHDDFNPDVHRPPTTFDINESEILKKNQELRRELEGASHSNFAYPRRMADLENEISPLKVANSKDLYETEADLNVNRELLKNSAQQSSIASALRVARPDAPSPSRTEDESAGGTFDDAALNRFLQDQKPDGEAPNELKPVVFSSFEDSRHRFSPQPHTPRSPSTFMAELRLNSSILSQLNPDQCRFCIQRPIRAIIKDNLNAKYLTSRDFYNVKIVNDIIYNECTHIVSIFKDFLIYDDISEFLKRFYQTHETRSRLPKIFEFYDKYSKVFPNYVILGESKYMFKNIERKQRAIDEKNQQLVDMDKRKKKPRGGGAFDDLDHTDSNRLFSTRFIESVNQIKKLGMSSSIATTKKTGSMSVLLQKKERPLEEMPLDQLVEKFLQKDSELQINLDQEEKKEQKPAPKPRITSAGSAYPKPKIIGFGGPSDKSAQKPSVSKKNEPGEAKKPFNLNIYNNYNQYVNEVYYQAQTVNIHHNNYAQPQPRPEEAPRTNHFAAHTAQARKNSVEPQLRTGETEDMRNQKDENTLRGQMSSGQGMTRNSSRPYLHEDPKSKLNRPQRPLSSAGNKVMGQARVVSANSRPVSGAVTGGITPGFISTQQQQQQPQPAFGSSTATNRFPEANLTPRAQAKGSSSVTRKDKPLREQRKSSATRQDYQAQYQEYVNEYMKRKESAVPEPEPVYQKKIVPSLKLEDIGANFALAAKTPSLSPSSARSAVRPSMGFEFVREEDQGAFTTRGAVVSTEHPRKRSQDIGIRRPIQKTAALTRPAPYTNNFFQEPVTQHYRNLQGKSSSFVPSAAVVSRDIAAMPDIKAVSGASSARGPSTKVSARPTKLKSTDLGSGSAATSASARRTQYSSSAKPVGSGISYPAKGASAGVSVQTAASYRVRQGSTANLSGSTRSKVELTSGELSYGSAKENQPAASRHHFVQTTPKSLSKAKQTLYAPIGTGTYEPLHYQAPAHLASSASRSARGASVSSTGSQQAPGHYNQVPNVARKMTASVLAKQQPSVRGASTSSNSSNGSNRSQRSKERDLGGTTTGHYGGFYNRPSFGQLGGGYQTHYNYQLEHPANQHYNHPPPATDTRGSYEYLMAKPRTTYEPKATGHYTKPAAAGKKKMAYSKSVENLKGGTGVVRASYQPRASVAAAAAPETVHEAKYIKTLEQKTNQLLKAHNSREKVLPGVWGRFK